MGGLQRTIELIESKSHSDDDIILLVEDDYLFAESGLSQWIQACAEFNGSVTPFDHPDRYIRSDDWFGSRSEVMIIGDRHWRECESTTGVVGGKYKFFRKTALIGVFLGLRLEASIFSDFGELSYHPLTEFSTEEQELLKE